MNKISWQSPSNIALVKYWGKHGVQLPSNPSLSFTLNNCHTTTELQWEAGDGNIDLLFDGQRKERFTARARDYISSIASIFPFLKEYNLHIDSTNNFPHSAGIASSASAMSSLALCLCSMEYEVTGKTLTEEEFYQKASNIARLGSGSAARSVYGGYVSWGKSDKIPGSSDEYATPLPMEINESFKDIRDTILIVDQGIKVVSSRAGHKLMDRHPYAQQRFARANKNFNDLTKALQEGDDPNFIRIVEQEALGLHALMMSSTPGYILLKANTLNIIHRIRAFRDLSCTTLCFTLDAGPNVHLLYHGSDSAEVEEFITEELLLYCSDKYRIDDHIGNGPEKV
ncbi:MAG: diphosphomevalonate decarboxylase [Bacteroidetes bacterium]|nr:MAG: diphosphomevalonate decarboxylase [Bacteroidota bacterium]